MLHIVPACSQATEDIGKTLSAIKGCLYGTGTDDPQPEVVSQIAMGLYELLEPLIVNMPKLEFEVRVIV